LLDVPTAIVDPRALENYQVSRVRLIQTVDALRVPEMDLLPPRISAADLQLLSAILVAPVVGPSGLRLRLIRESVSWQRLIQMAEEHGVLFALIDAMARASLLPPVPHTWVGERVAIHPTVQIKSFYQEHLARRTRQKQQLSAILSTLNRHGIQPLLLKGARYLLAPAGYWSEARDMRDIDLLIHPETAQQALRALSEDGYVADQRPVPLDQHLPELWRDGCPSVIELHIEALSFSARRYLPTDHLWRHAERSTTADGDFFILPVEWQLLHAALNHQISDRCYAQRVLAMKPLWEIAMLARDVTDAGWRRLADHAAERGYADILGSSLFQAAHLFGMAMPPAIFVSPSAQAHVLATLRNAGAPEWSRRLRFLADQLRFAFARETLAVRYHVDENDVGVAIRVRHLHFLVHHYRGRTAMRLFGQRGQT
jgi:hypothetical protein